MKKPISSDKHYHLIGIGGIGMSGIAQLLLKRGMKVTGSDIKENKILTELKTLGAEVFIGHNPENIKGANTIIYSSAIREDNPEIREAKRQGICLVRRAEALAGLMKEETVITVAGSHGKTTTASLAAYLLLEAGFSPTIAVGGILRNIDTNAYLGDGNFFVAEADESDGSFLHYHPKYSIITNIDYEHLDYYKEFKNAVCAFGGFLNNTRDDGCAFICSDDTSLKDIIKGYKNKYVLFGLNEDADIYPENIRINGLSSEFDCFYQNKLIDRFYLALGGKHNISNALSVIALGLELGIDLAVIKDTLASYKGARRRLEIKFSNKDYLLVDDYAHHPTEIRATLLALRSLKSDRLVAIFQPHRYTRTKLLLDEFARSFDLADQVIITDIYAAGEDPIEGVNAGIICEKIKERLPDKQVYFLPRKEIAKYILENIRPHDLAVTLGAGDIVKTCDELVEELKRKS
ncbi:MAG: UDP-N-acetylmuramate--L-alanine ligase [Candidatus Omnitrophota bacterium]